MLPRVIWVTPGGRQPRPEVRPASVAGVVARVTIVGVVLTFALAVISAMLARGVGDELAARSFERVARATAASLAPAVDADPSRPPAASGDLGVQAASVLAAGPVVAVTVRDASGRVLWSDRADTIGRVTPLPADARRALDTGSVVSAAEGSGGPAGSPLVAHAGIRDVHGTPVLLDLTDRADEAPAVSRQAWLALVPAALVALLLLVLAELSLTWRLAAQARRHQRHDAVLLRTAVDAPDAERRRLAGELHDSVLPILSGVAMELDAARLRSGPGTAARLPPGVVSSVRRAIDELRALVSGPGPAQERVPELAGRLRNLATELEDAGLRVSVRASGTAGLPDTVAGLLFRSAREALRNAASHSEATSAEVTVSREGPMVTLVVDDDGRGFDEQRLDERRRLGHVGLDTLGDLVVRAGGSLTANSSPGHGTRLVVTLPVDATAVGARP
jgi:two-component system, NarL family, sensor kinase